MNLFLDNHCVSNSPSKIEGVRGSMIDSIMLFNRLSYSSVASRQLLYLRGAADYQRLIFVELTLILTVKGTKELWCLKI